MPPRCTPGEVPQTCLSRRRPYADLGHAGDFISLGWHRNTSGFPPEEPVERSFWASLLRLLPQ